MPELEYLETIIGVTPAGVVYVMKNEGPDHLVTRFDPHEGVAMGLTPPDAPAAADSASDAE